MGAKKPKPPPVPAPVPMPVAAIETEEEAMKRARQRSGYSQTILAGSLTPKSSGKSTKFGGG